MEEKDKIVISTADDIDRFVDQLISSKAALLNVRLLAVVMSANSPSETIKVIDGLVSRRKKEAARQLAKIVRDYDGSDILGAIMFLKSNKDDFESMRKTLKEKYALQSSDEALQKEGHEDGNSEVSKGSKNP